MRSLTVLHRVIDRDTEPEAPLSPGADHDRTVHRVGEAQLDVGVGKPGSSRPVHFHRREIQSPRYERRTRRAKRDRFWQPRMLTPSRQFRKVEGTVPLVNGRKRGRPPSGSANPPARIGRDRAPLLIVPRSNDDIEAFADETADGECRIARFPSGCSVGFRRHPECESMYPATRVFVTDIWKRKEARNLIALAAEAMAVQDVGGIAMDAPGASPHRPEEQRRHRGLCR